MLFIALAIIDLIASVLGLIQVSLGLMISESLIYFLMLIVFFKGLWSVYSFPPGLIGWIDLLTPLIFGVNYYFSTLSVLAYLMLALLFGKGLFCLMSLVTINK